MSESSKVRGGTTGVLFSMCLSLVLVVGSVSALNLALPDLAVSLKATNSDLTWIADAYTVALGALVLPLGAIGDRWGRRNVLVAGTVVFGLSSFAAGLVDSPSALIGLRVAMGVGAAMIMPGTLSTITAAFPADRRARGVAIWSGFAAAGAIIGMLVSGALLEKWGWQSIFIVGAFVAVGAAASALMLAPNTKDEHQGVPDVPGATLIALAIGCLVYAIIEGNATSWTTARVVIAFAVFVLASVGYVLVDLRSTHPILDPRLFVLRGFRAGGITVLVQFMALFGFFFVGLQYLQLILGYSPFHAAVALVPVAAVVLPVSALTPAVVQRLGAKYVLSAGLALIGAGLTWLSTITDASGYLPFLGGIVVSGVGVGLAGSTGTDSITGSLPRAKQGIASAMNDATREVGSAIGIALMGSTYSHKYAAALPALDRLPASAASATRDSAAAGLAVSRQLGARGAGLEAAVRHAFITGLSASLVVTAVIVGIAAIAVLVRGPRTSDLIPRD